MNKAIKCVIGSCFVKSFRKLDKRVFLIMGSEILLVLSIILLALLSTLSLQSGLDKIGITPEITEKISKNFNNDTFARDFLEGKMQNAEYSKDFSSFLSRIGINIVISLLAIAIAFSFFKSFEWSIIKRAKLTRKFFLRYLGLFIIWNCFWILLILFSVKTIKENSFKIVGGIELFLFIYFSFILYPVFVENKKIFLSIKKTFKLGTTQIHKFILPIINIWIMLQIGYALLSLLSKIPLVFPLMAALCLFFYITWIKVYMLEVTNNVQ